MRLKLIIIAVKCMLWLRYRIKVKGLSDILAKGTKGTLFLPNHPALIDPVIVGSIIMGKYKVRALADEKQVKGTILKYFANILRVLSLPDIVVKGSQVKDQVIEQIDNCVQALKDGDNLLMYPAGRLYRTRYEKLRANGGVERILQKYPDVRIVLVRTTGLWGSSFSRSRGYQPTFGEALWPHWKHIVANLFFFGPRREVTVEFFNEPSDFPRTGGREAMNRYLEKFYNETSQPNTYVPYTIWERGKTRTVPEPEVVSVQQDTSEVPADIREKVYAQLREMTSLNEIRDEQTLGTELSMDSLMIAELATWIQDEFGQPVPNPEMMRTVASVLLAAIGRSAGVEPLKTVPEEWFVDMEDTLAHVAPGANIAESFLNNAAERPDYPLLADQMKGMVTHRKMVLSIMVLKGIIEKIPGERIGFIMPACLTANIVYMAMVFAGKVPVMINWTVGLRNMEHCMKNAGVETVLTSATVIDKLEGKGTDFGELKKNFLYLEDMVKGVSTFTKIGCLLKSKFCWSSLRKAKIQDICAILFTSGSENFPKAVPIRHKELLTCLGSALDGLELYRGDTVIGMLPPFHSFGLLVNMALCNCSGIRVVFHTNPTEGDMIARLVSAYKATMLVGTPTFAHGILRNALKKQVESLRVVITGAEKCPQQTFDLVAEKCPNARINEGYGITECAPVVALNKPGNTRLGSLGKVLSCMEWKILDEDMNPVKEGETGMLYVSGDNVFQGYLNFDGPSPFVELDGKRFYKTGDLVAAEDDFLIFKGRKKRFVKVAGEMVSLPAIEEVLMKAYRKPDGDLPLAVEAVGTEQQPDITLFTIMDITRDDANATIRGAGLSPIHMVKNVVKLESIPLLGSGKTDYRSLKSMKI